MAPARRSCAGFRNFSGGIHTSRARRAHVGLTVYPPWIQPLGTLPPLVLSHAIEIKIRTSSRHKAQLALDLCLDEVQILIFDDPPENERGQQP